MDRYVSTGLFDPWALAREQAEARYLVAWQQERDAAPPLRLTPQSTPEEVQAFRDRVQGNSKDMAEEVERWMMDGVTEWERWSADLFFELYREAWWMAVAETHQFADGRPLAAQNELRALLLQVIVNGMLARKNGAKPETGGSREATPEEIDQQWRAETQK
jgi:hypothetical protein